MLTVDAQVHVWPADSPRWPWTPGWRQQKHRPHGPVFGAGELLAAMDAAGVDAAVLVPPSLWAGFSNEFALEAAVEHPGRLSVMGTFDLTDMQARAGLGSWLAAPGMTGIRLSFLNEPQASQLRAGEADWIWPVLAEAGVPVAVNAGGVLDHFAGVAKRYPALRLAIDHFGVRQVDHDLPLGPRIAELLRLAALPNVVVKASGFSPQSHEPYPFRDLHEAIGSVVERFGPERVFWGTDITRLCHPGPELADAYARERTYMLEALDRFGSRTTELVMGRAIVDWLGWRRAGERP